MGAMVRRESWEEGTQEGIVGLGLDPARPSDMEDRCENCLRLDPSLGNQVELLQSVVEVARVGSEGGVADEAVCVLDPE